MAKLSPMSERAELVIDAKLTLGEGPVWHPIEQVLYCVDIRGKSLCRLEPSEGSLHKWDVGEEIGVAVPTERGHFLLGLQTGLALFDPATGEIKLVDSLEHEMPNNRCNDGKCDPSGRFWVGTMDNLEKDISGKLYSYQTGGAQMHLEDIAISNGLAWSADHKKMYYIDSPTLSIQVFDFDLEKGSISKGRTIIRMEKEMGFPDGMTIDQEDKLWVAHWGGSCIRRWDPESGSVLQKVEVDAPHTSSCAFGGPDHDTLYITSARKGLSEKELQKYPLSGGIFSFKPSVGGFPTVLFK